MAAKADALLMTVAQFRNLRSSSDVVLELHWGQVITLTRPKLGHSKIQYRLAELLRPLLESQGVVTLEFPFRALPEYDLRGADVAFISQRRWDDGLDDDNVHGSPELVIEVLSPSNTKAEMREKAALYLSTGCQQFWVVDPKRKTVQVTTQAGETSIYGVGDRISVLLVAEELDVASIFAN